MTTHKRARLTSDCVRHAASDVVPCWCGATDAKPGGINVLSALPWTSGSIAYLIESFSKSTHQLPRGKTS